MNNERMTFLLTYLDGLTTLTANEYRCNTEIGECIGWIREEFTKEYDSLVSVPTGAIEALIHGPETLNIHDGHSARVFLFKDDSDE